MFSLIKHTKPNTQMRIIAEIFENNKNIPISKKELENQFGIRYIAKNIKYPIHLTCVEDLIGAVEALPGDLQRTIRTFYDKFKDYGVSQTGELVSITYTYSPILLSECDIIIKKVARQLFNETDRIAFIQSKNNKCQLCSSQKRLAIDHWRSHSVYNINDKRIAVLLCETCNNTHHNFDASHCIKKNMEIKYVKNWITIEKNIRSYGFYPNDNDLKTQRENIIKVNEYYDSMLSPLSIDFWQGLYFI